MLPHVHRCGNWGSEPVSYLPEVTRILSSNAKLESRSLCDPGHTYSTAMGDRRLISFILPDGLFIPKSLVFMLWHQSHKLWSLAFFSPLCFSVAQSCPTLCNPWTAAHQTSLSFTISWSLLKFTSIDSGMPSNHLILSCPLLLLPTIFPSIRVFSSESALHIMWPKYWSFSFSVSFKLKGVKTVQMWAGVCTLLVDRSLLSTLPRIWLR